MNVEIHAKNLEVDDRLRNYVEKKVNRLDRYLPHIAAVRVDLGTEHRRKAGDRPVAQLTVRNERGTILRAEDKQQADIFAAVDTVVDKIYRQISRYKGKRLRRTGERFAQVEPELAAAELPPIQDEDELDADLEKIVRRKQIELSPMNEQEAIDQMELLGHSFFVFYNADTSAVNVLYHRENGDYGLLEPQLG